MVGIFFGFWRKISLALLMGMILFTYTDFPELVAVEFDSAGKPSGFLDKEKFFYLNAGIVLGLNLLIGLLKNQLLKLDFSRLVPQSIWAQQRVALSTLLISWTDALLSVIHSFFIFILLGLRNINADTDQLLTINMNWLLLIGAVLLLGVLFSLPLLLFYTNPKVTD